MTITNIISAIGNNSSIYPLMVRDCLIEAPSKIIIARKENLKESKEIANDATREKILDEYVTSAIWLGGIPFVEGIADKFITKRGFNPIVNLKLFKEEANKSKKGIYQGIEYNINKFKNNPSKEVQNAIQDLIKVRDNKAQYEKLLSKKFVAATVIPTIIMGFVLPKSIFALTSYIRKQRAKTDKTKNSSINQNITFSSLNRDTFQNFKSFKINQPSFTGNFTSTIANFRTVDKMAISDGGLTLGRVTTARNKEEASANAFRMIGSLILNFVTPIYIAKGLDKLANTIFKINVNLDPKILDNKDFIKAIQTVEIELPKSNTEKEILEFLDNKPNSLFSKFAQEMKKVSYFKSETNPLENEIRDPRKYVDIKDLGKFRNEFANFIKSAKEASQTGKTQEEVSRLISKFAKKAKIVKGINILANVGISSFLLAGVLPTLTYEFIKLTTGTYSDPGLVTKK